MIIIREQYAFLNQYYNRFKQESFKINFQVKQQEFAVYLKLIKF